jgi:hypothetical protein
MMNKINFALFKSDTVQSHEVFTVVYNVLPLYCFSVSTSHTYLPMCASFFFSYPLYTIYPLGPSVYISIYALLIPSFTHLLLYRSRHKIKMLLLLLPPKKTLRHIVFLAFIYPLIVVLLIMP